MISSVVAPIADVLYQGSLCLQRNACTSWLRGCSVERVHALRREIRAGTAAVGRSGQPRPKEALVAHVEEREEDALEVVEGREGEQGRLVRRDVVGLNDELPEVCHGPHLSLF